MSGHLRWDHCAERKRKSEEIAEVDESRVVSANLVNRARNADDIHWLEELLQVDLRDFHRQKILRSIEWLKEVPSRTLGHDDGKSGWRDYYQRLQAVLVSGKYFEDMTPEEAGKVRERNQHTYRFRRACRAEVNKRPAWMDNPALLPKKPPPLKPSEA